MARSSNFKRERFSSTKISNSILKCFSESVGIVVVCGCVLSSNKNPEQQVNNDNTMIIPVCIMFNNDRFSLKKKENYK
jgi:hypothetical protein